VLRAQPATPEELVDRSGQFLAVDAVEKDKSGHPGANLKYVLCSLTFLAIC
jgi:transketolase